MNEKSEICLFYSLNTAVKGILHTIIHYTEHINLIFNIILEILYLNIILKLNLLNFDNVAHLKYNYIYN